MWIGRILRKKNNEEVEEYLDGEWFGEEEEISSPIIKSVVLIQQFIAIQFLEVYKTKLEDVKKVVKEIK